MTILSNLVRAIELATTMHRFQRDAAGEPYILHPLRVMLAVRDQGGNEAEQIAAVLHDVVEDTGFALDTIGKMFGNRVEHLVDALTRRFDGEEPYEEFINRVIEAGPSAMLIKEIDVNDNLRRIDPVRQIDPAKADRLERKYKSALTQLWQARSYNAD